MISIIITAYKEPDTIGKAIEAFAAQKVSEEIEILIACPDQETKSVVNAYEKKYSFVKHVQDPGKGKPIALNLCFKKIRGKIIIMSDGDVFVSPNSINELMKELKKGFGAVSGRPISLNSRNNMMGYFSHLLTDIGAHDTRKKFVRQNKFIVCSGYLYAMNRLIDKIPEDALSDDAVISHLIWNKGYKIGYAPEAKVYVRYPPNFKEWIKQKKRSAGGYNQLKQYNLDKNNMRSFTKEIIEGWCKPFKYPKNFKEFIWTIWLYPCRLYLWLKIYQDINLKKKSFSEIWTRIESTK